MTYDDEDRPDTAVVFSRARAGEVALPRKPALELSPEPVSHVAEAALQGLLAPRKTLPPALFYDEEGCRLFYEITRLPEYYLTRTEFRLLQTTAPEVAAQLPPGATLVEYGASDETKAEMLLGQTVRSGSAAGKPVFRT